MPDIFKLMMRRKVLVDHSRHSVSSRSASICYSLLQVRPIQQVRSCRHLQLWTDVGASAKLMHNCDMHLFCKKPLETTCTLRVEFSHHQQIWIWGESTSNFWRDWCNLMRRIWQSWPFCMPVQAGNHGHWRRLAVTLLLIGAEHKDLNTEYCG